MRLFRLILAAVIGLFALIMGGIVAVCVLVGGAIALILTRLGLARGQIKVNVQRGAGARPASARTTRVHSPDAIDVETTPVAGASAALPGEQPPKT